MTRSLLDSDEVRPQFAGHETFPLRYGWLKKAYDEAVVNAETAEQSANLFNDDRSIALFGVGRNMVISIKHWALATDILSLKDRTGERMPAHVAGQLGELLFGDSLDPYLEHPGSLWLLHWRLAGRPGRATAWHWAFNEFHEPSFDRELMRRRLQRRCEELAESGRMGKDRTISDITVRRDIECLIRTYFAIVGGARRSPEDSIECPLAELGLIQKAGMGELFHFRRGPKASLPDEVFLFALVEFWRTYFPGRRSFSVDFLAFERGSPGQVFLLDEEAIADRLIRLDDLTDGALRWDESSGMRQLYAHDLDGIDEWGALRGMYERDMKADAA